MSFIGRLFRRKTEYILMLPRRGGRKILAKIIARDPAEAQEKAISALEQLQEDHEIRQYKYVILLDPKSLSEFKIDNPFFQEEEEEEETRRGKRGKEERITPEDIQQLMLASIANSIPNVVNQAMNLGINIGTQIANQVVKTVLDAFGMKESNPKAVVAEAIADVLSAMAENPAGFFAAVSQGMKQLTGGKAVGGEAPNRPIIIHRGKKGE